MPSSDKTSPLFESPFILLLPLREYLMALWKSSCEAVSIVILPCCICAHFALPARKMDIASSIMSHSNRSRNPHSLCPTCDLDQSFLLLTLEVSLLLERPLPLVDFPLAKKVSCGIPFRFPGRKLGTLLSVSYTHLTLPTKLEV